MNAAIKLETPLTVDTVRNLRIGGQVLLSGVVYTARDIAHKRLYNLCRKNLPLPVDLHDQIIYYTGPSPARPGYAVGSAGPTTSSRMDEYTPYLIEKCGLRAMIGKGNRSPNVVAAIQRFTCVYFAAPGGAGALLAKKVRKADIVCYEDLGPEAIYRLEVNDMPLIVAIDCSGSSLY
jgi:fumarate hydratase subunit beta